MTMTLSPSPELILALESSCDDTAVAIVRHGREVLASVRQCQTALHATFGGVVPEAAARAHIVAVNEVLAEALKVADYTLDDMDAFAATLGPGLIGSLLIGANTAKTLSLITGKPFLGVHHLYGHVASNYLESDLKPPFLCLLVSGGHTQLIVVEDWNTMRIVGETLDDAVGEAYDKIARAIGLPYPGGPEVDRLSTIGNPKAFKLPKARTEKLYDFSFSGLKTATLRAYEKAAALLPASDDPTYVEAKAQLQADLSASFQHTVIQTLLDKVTKYAEENGIKALSIAGGVSANKGLRQAFQEWIDQKNQAQKSANSADQNDEEDDGRTEQDKRLEYHLYVPKMAYCTDNAAMIAASAYVNPISRDASQEVFSRSGFIAAK